MKQTLKQIKDKYGEGMSHFCRANFSTILNTEPKFLYLLLQELFAPSHHLYPDLVANHLEYEFVDYVYSFVSRLNKDPINRHMSPQDLLHEVGYTLYECKTYEELQNFKKYYAKDEALCTFNDQRLEKCYVYFAIRSDADTLKRSEFSNPHRQDIYGTSVLSIQFFKSNHLVSIKNRYNHTVSNPDATYANNLDNIVPGLTKAFEQYHGITPRTANQNATNQLLFDIPGYIMAEDGKFYKYNYEINNIYYCPNNIIIDNYQVISYPHERYLVIDYFILDLQNKTFMLYDPTITDEFSQVIGHIKNIQIINDKPNKRIIITNNRHQTITLTINHLNNLLSINNKPITISFSYKYLKQRDNY